MTFENNVNQTETVVNEVIEKNDMSDAIEEKSIETSIAEIGLTPAITETTSFQLVLQEIPQRVAEANKLLKSYRDNPDTFIDTVDDAELEKQMASMSEIFTFVKDIDESRMEIKRYINGVRDNIIEVLDKRLEDASYNQLSQAQQDIRQLRKDVVADRREKRWKEVQPTFDANALRYPDLQQYAPELLDFSKFKLIHSDLISGAKTRNVREKDHTFINETMFGWNTAMQLLIQNSWGLTVQHLNELLTMFKQNPSVELVNREGQRLKEMMEAQEIARKAEEERRRKAEEERKKREQEHAAELARIQEQERQAKLAQDIKQQEEAAKRRTMLEEQAKVAEQQERERQEKMMQFGNQYQTIFKESFPDFINYLFANQRYHNVHSDPFTKVQVVYDIMKQTENNQSIVAKETNMNPEKIIELVRYILDA